jgi:hypothetical protein
MTAALSGYLIVSCAAIRFFFAPSIQSRSPSLISTIVTSR